MLRFACVLVTLSSLLPVAFAQSGATLTVDAGTSVSPVSPTLYGLMTEEINYSYEGGLYPELLRNNTLLHSWSGFDHWRLVEHGTARAAMAEAKDGPSTALPTSLRLTLTGNAAGSESGIANEGFGGIAVRPSTVYQGSFYSKPETENVLHARLVSDATGATLAEATVPVHPGSWQRYAYTLHTAANVQPGAANHFEVLFEQPGSVDLQLFSLMPPTYHDRPDGLRSDLMEKLAAMQPKFLRFPGGNYLEGNDLANHFDWKKTIGPRVDRPGHESPWDYHSTDGMGLLEFLGWCEDLHMQPLLAVFAGYTLHGQHVTGDELKPYIQDDLDELEYLTGDPTTKWGAERARDGHPAPFTLHYIEIGNEDNFDKSGSYNERFASIAQAIRAKYPQLKLIATTPVTEGNPDLIDDHYYKTPEEFYSMVHQYDHADRNGPKIMVGEWATREGSPTPDFGAALGDAAWMTGMERNSDLILLASYAPLLVNVDPGNMQWSSDLIGFDALHSYGSPSYWAQVLFANHLGDHTVRSSSTGTGDRFFWSATVSTQEKVLHLKLVNASSVPLPLTLDLSGARHGAASAYTLQAETTWVTNTILRPETVTPLQTKVQIPAGNWQHTLPARSIQVLDIPLQ